ncbi:MAG: glycosyltransferase family 4 protein [Myxococcaceae bacterium]|nr:glycosyltransferase family 4 protein [Myxococcaceae bacterium]
MTRLVFVVNNPDFLVSHRLVLVRGARAAGYDVHAITPDGSGVGDLERLGVEVHRWRLDRKGQGPATEASSVAALVWHYARLQPDIAHHVTIKPVLYGSAAARVVRRTAVVNAVSGFGYVFLAQGPLAALRRRAIAAAYRMALSTPRSVVVLQNDDDEADLRRFGALDRADVVKIRGSGVDLTRFRVAPEPEGPPVVMLPARLLRDKGVVEFVDAARAVRANRPGVRFVLAGGLDPGNPAAVTLEEVERWRSEGVVEWWGHQRDMAAAFGQATLVCLPSYREGMPKALLEAAAVGRALLTTDAPGCRDAVDGGRAGVLFPVKDSAALARAIIRLVDDPQERQRLAKEARRLAEERFDEQAVLRAHLNLYERLRSASR